jgi:hypothetical protein
MRDTKQRISPKGTHPLPMPSRLHRALASATELGICVLPETVDDLRHIAGGTIADRQADDREIENAEALLGLITPSATGPRLRTGPFGLSTRTHRIVPLGANLNSRIDTLRNCFVAPTGSKLVTITPNTSVLNVLAVLADDPVLTAAVQSDDVYGYLLDRIDVDLPPITHDVPAVQAALENLEQRLVDIGVRRQLDRDQIKMTLSWLFSGRGVDESDSMLVALRALLAPTVEYLERGGPSAMDHALRIATDKTLATLTQVVESIEPFGVTDARVVYVESGEVLVLEVTDVALDEVLNALRVVCGDDVIDEPLDVPSGDNAIDPARAVQRFICGENAAITTRPRL